MPLFGIARSARPAVAPFTSTIIPTVRIRGGAKKGDGTENLPDFETDNEEVDDEAEEGDEGDAGTIGDWATGSVSNFAASIVNKTPPLTKLYIGSSLLITVLSFILNKNRWPEILDFSWPAILGGQIWRLCTAFLFFGQLDVFFPLTMQFVWQHMSQLEKLSHKKPEDFLTLLLFGAGSLVTIYTVLGISTKFLGHNLATYLVYIWSRVYEGSDVNFMDLMVLKAEALPWVFCLQSLLLEQELPLADLIGIAVGHLYYYLKNKEILSTPDILRSWFQSEEMKAKYAKFKAEFE